MSFDIQRKNSGASIWLCLFFGKCG